MAEEIQVEIELDYRRALVVPLSQLASVLKLLCENQYKVEGYGAERTIQRIGPDDLPNIKLVPPHMLLSARLKGDAQP
jgi:hypothetical protein